MPEGTYSEWDAHGIPLTDGEGKPLSKNAAKKLQKRLRESAESTSGVFRMAEITNRCVELLEMLLHICFATRLYAK